MRGIGAITITAAALATAGLAGCGGQAQFAGSMYYGNLVTEAQANDIRDRAFAQLVDRAAAVGLKPQQQEPGRIIFRTQLPDWVGRGPEGEAVTRPDLRELIVEVIQGREVASRSYRYNAYIRGQEPAGFTPDARARLGLALLAVREVFEMPLETDFFPQAGG